MGGGGCTGGIGAGEGTGATGGAGTKAGRGQRDTTQRAVSTETQQAPPIQKLSEQPARAENNQKCAWRKFTQPTATRKLQTSELS